MTFHSVRDKVIPAISKRFGEVRVENVTMANDSDAKWMGNKYHWNSPALSIEFDASAIVAHKGVA
jgi:hypothetical protein